MASEVTIAQGHGLIPAPKQSKPAPPDATAARQDYEAGLKQFEELVSRIRTYCGHQISADVATATIDLVSHAVRLAGEVRNKADKLKHYPDTFMRVGANALPFPAIAAAAGQAYSDRLAELEKLEERLGKVSANTSEYRLIDLKLHEGVKGGHLGRKHVAKTMDDFKQRWHEEEKKGKILGTLSSFIGDPQLGINDPRIVQVVSRAIHLAQDQIQASREGKRIYININELSDIGYFKERGMPPSFTKCGFLVAFKDSSHPHGLRILTAELGETHL